MKRLSYLVIAGLMFMASCDESTIDFDATDEQNIENEAVTDAYFEDVDDLAALAVSSDAATLTGGKEGSSGRMVNKPNDHRWNCPGVVITIEVGANSTLQLPQGVITIDFGAGCEDDRGNVRKGKIIITYNGRRFFPGSSIVTTFDGYEFNGILIEGVRTLTNVTGSLEENPTFTITIVGGKVTWPDGTIATREVSHTREWVRASNPLNDQWIVTGSAAGINRHGVEYAMEITKPLVYKRRCAFELRIILPVEGTKVFTSGDKEVIIDFGNGECDNLITVTVNGISREIEVGNRN